MVGQKASVLNWNGTQGRVQYEGEDWKAVCAKPLELSIGEDVVIERVDKLKLTIRV
jgi:membrane protein implicated in regulation of membrane protease activity